jgi:isochorismate hydrolase
MAEKSDDEWKVLDELAPSKEDLVIKKHNASFFMVLFRSKS